MYSFKFYFCLSGGMEKVCILHLPRRKSPFKFFFVMLNNAVTNIFLLCFYSVFKISLDFQLNNGLILHLYLLIHIASHYAIQLDFVISSALYLSCLRCFRGGCVKACIIHIYDWRSSLVKRSRQREMWEYKVIDDCCG